MAEVHVSKVGTNAYILADDSDANMMQYWFDQGFIVCPEQPEVPFEQQGFFYLLEDITWEWRQTVNVPVNFNVLTNEIKYNVWKDVYRSVTPTMLGAATEAEIQALQAALTALTARVDALTA